jgi:hypothetical protein
MGRCEVGESGTIDCISASTAAAELGEFAVWTDWRWKWGRRWRG